MGKGRGGAWRAEGAGEDEEARLVGGSRAGVVPRRMWP